MWVMKLSMGIGVSFLVTAKEGWWEGRGDEGGRKRGCCFSFSFSSEFPFVLCGCGCEC